MQLNLSNAFDSRTVIRGIIPMATKTAFVEEREASDRLAEMTRHHFEKLPEQERKTRLKAMTSLRIRNRKTSKHPSTPAWG
jgi:hypothetical protein